MKIEPYKGSTSVEPAAGSEFDGPSRKEKIETAGSGTSETHDTGPLPGPELLRLLHTAHAMGVQNSSADRHISTSMILFALASSDTAPLQTHSPEALCFAKTLKDVAEDRFEKTWDTYFNFPPSAIPSTGDFSSDDVPPLSANAAIWLQKATQAARQASHQQVEVGDLISALWGLTQGRCLYRLQTMAVDMRTLHKHYEQRLLSLLIPEVPAANQAASTPPATSQQSPQPNNIRKYLQHDRASHLDQLGFKQYAISIAAFLTSRDTHGPISISIQAPWGMGKSSLMRQIQYELDPPAEQASAMADICTLDVMRFLDRQIPPTQQIISGPDKRWTVWFNAWKYESSEEVWAGLVDAIISQVSERLGRVQRELFLLRLNLARIDDGLVRKKIYQRVAALWWGTIRRWVLAAMALLLSFGSISVITYAVPDLKLWNLASMSGAVGTQIAIAAYAVWAFFQSRKKVENEPAKFSLAEYVRVPDYAKSVGVMHQIHQDLRRVLDILPKRMMQDCNGTAVTEPLVIFIDDLDRCTPNKIASVVEGLNAFLAGDQSEFLFVIGMDPQVVAAALEHAHKDVKSHLPSYEQVVPLGWRFMDKFIQLGFTIPPIHNVENDTFIDFLIGPDTPETKNTPAAAIPNTPLSDASASVASREEHRVADKEESARILEQRQREASVAFRSDGKDVQTIMRGICKEYHCSPREIKRTLNFVRFLLLLRISRTTHQLPIPTLSQYQRWAMLCMRWPDLALWLQWGSTLPLQNTMHPVFGNVAAQRLYWLEQCSTDTQGGIEEWGKSAADKLGLPVGKVSWLASPEVYNFFVQETLHPTEYRISAGANIGFY